MHKFLELLGVTEEASEEDINRAYRAKLLRLHPDHNHTLEATLETQALNSARDDYQASLKTRHLELSQVFTPDEINTQHFNKTIKALFLGITDTPHPISSEAFFQFLSNIGPKTKPPLLNTLGLDYTNYLVHCPNSCNPFVKLQAWLLAKPDRFKILTPAYYKGAKVIVFFAIGTQLTEEWIEQCLAHNRVDIKKVVVGDRDTISRYQDKFGLEAPDLVWITHDVLPTEALTSSTSCLAPKSNHQVYQEVLSSLLVEICNTLEPHKPMICSNPIQSGGFLPWFNGSKSKESTELSLSTVINELDQTKDYFLETTANYSEEKTQEKLRVLDNIRQQLHNEETISAKELEDLKAPRSTQGLAQYKSSSQGKKLANMIKKFQSTKKPNSAFHNYETRKLSKQLLQLEKLSPGS